MEIEVITDKIKKLNELLDGIYLYNYHVEESPLGSSWVRVRSYSCIDLGQPDHVQDFDARQLMTAFQQNQGCKNPEDFLSNLEKSVKNNGPAQPNYRDGSPVPPDYTDEWSWINKCVNDEKDHEQIS